MQFFPLLCGSVRFWTALFCCMCVNKYIKWYFCVTVQRKRCLYSGSGWLCEGGGRHRGCPSGSLFWCCKYQLHWCICGVHFGQHTLLGFPAPGHSLRVIDVQQSSHLLLQSGGMSCSFVFSWALPLGACAGLEISMSLAWFCVVWAELTTGSLGCQGSAFLRGWSWSFGKGCSVALAVKSAFAKWWFWLGTAALLSILPLFSASISLPTGLLENEKMLSLLLSWDFIPWCERILLHSILFFFLPLLSLPSVCSFLRLRGIICHGFNHFSF